MSGMGGQNKPSGLQISFPLAGYVSEYDILQILKEDLSKNGNKWLSYEGRKWQFNSADFKKEIEGFEAEEWLNGTIIPEISIDHKRRTVFDREEETTFYKIIITPDMVSDQMPRRIFLSHKGTNKPLVKNFAFALRAVGLTPWLDEEAMHAGVNLERGLIAGFNESCAAVFFVTPDFKDEAYLASEVNYAIAQKRKKATNSAS